MNNACPECGAIYAVAEKDIGRRIACKKCNTSLVVTGEGLERDAPAAPPASSKKDRAADRDRDWNLEDDDGSGRKRDDRGSRRRRGRDEDDDDKGESRPRKPRGPGAGEILNKLKGLKSVADVPTWLYGIGLVLTIFSFFAPQIDKAKVAGRQGDALYPSWRIWPIRPIQITETMGNLRKTIARLATSERKSTSRTRPALEIRSATPRQTHCKRLGGMFGTA